MKIVHSYWSKPSILYNKSSNEKAFGGWRDKKYEYMSWALSCLTLKKFYPNIELVTDIAGKNLLIDKLQLPYKTVRIDLDCLNKYPEQLWAIGKLYTYSIQNEPFIHVDNDVFIWERFSNAVENAPLVAQHIDDDERDYNFAFNYLKKNNIKIPTFLEDDLKKYHRFNSSNAGIIGGNDFAFFKEYTKEAFGFIDSQLDKINQSIKGSLYAIIYEQYLYSVMARKKGIRIQHVFEEEEKKSMDLVNFMNKYRKKKYVHLYAFSKYFPEYCRELEHQLLLEYPEFHSIIMSIIKNDHSK
ncbi:MAG: hypothetical protein CMH46_01490 [Muricauda sp.]|nr:MULTISPECIES: DUF6734 family protein [unclassified Allomuricauda]MAU14197.1 hypothetical protein [Allomuricauda sp.]|tara:strand:- start:773 stop:1666 length:894 start_codon:yes stop_codon:yes gene_type:complete